MVRLPHRVMKGSPVEARTNRPAGAKSVARSSRGRGDRSIELVSARLRAQISSVTPGLGTGGSSIGPHARVLGKVSSFELSACSQVTALPV